MEKIPPLKKGDKGGFEFEFSRCHRLKFLNELLRHHTSTLLRNFVCRLLKKISEARHAVFVVRDRGSCSCEHEKRARFVRDDRA